MQGWADPSGYLPVSFGAEAWLEEKADRCLSPLRSGGEREVEGWWQIREAHGTCLLTALESWFQRVIRGVAVVRLPQA